MIKAAVLIAVTLKAVLPMAAFGFAFSDYIEDDLNVYPDPLAQWLDQGGRRLCLRPLQASNSLPLAWFSLEANSYHSSLPLFRGNWFHQALASGDCLYQKTVLRVASDFPETALNQPYFFKCASDQLKWRGERLQFALEPIDEVRFKLHWPDNAQIDKNGGKTVFSTTILQQTDASACQAR